MSMILTIAVLALAVNIFFLMKQIWTLQAIVRITNEQIVDQKRTIDDLRDTLKYELDTQYRDMKVLILTLQADAIRAVQEPKKEEPTKLPGANRKPRTEEQKAQAAQKRKEWWEKKRAEEAKEQTSSPAPEVTPQLLPSPNA